MPPVSIDNPILNSPFREPARHFRFDEDGITSEIAEGRRRSTYFVPIAKPKTKGGAQLLTYLVAITGIQDAEFRAHHAARPRLRAVK